MTAQGPEVELVDISLRLPRSMVESVILAARRSVDGTLRDKAALARIIASGRHRRSQILSRIRFGEPSWDMILDLYLAGCDGQKRDVISLCQSSGVPQTTALRYVDMLEQQGLIRREPDQTDGRRMFVVAQESLLVPLERWLDLEIAALGIAAL